MIPYWIDALFVHKDIIIVGHIGNDGLLLKLTEADARPILTYLNCPEDGEGWFFNSSKDRYIAEKKYDKNITANPQLMYRAGFEIIT